LGKGDFIVPIPGTKRRAYLEENAGAVDVKLSEVTRKPGDPPFRFESGSGNGATPVATAPALDSTRPRLTLTVKVTRSRACLEKF
jgi:hypothetical protein